MPQGDTTTPNPEETTEVKWFGEEELFSIGDRQVKIWELLVGLIIYNSKCKANWTKKSVPA